MLNDFYLKAQYHNWVTGKLSDFCGLFIFTSFWIAVFPNRKKVVLILVFFLFVYWKSPVSQPFIDFFSLKIFTIERVIDFTDLIALAILPIAFFYSKTSFLKFESTLATIPLAILTIFSFCATSIPRPSQVFKQPQYLLFKSGITSFETSEHPNRYEVYDLDSLLVIDLKEIRIDKRPPIDDEYHKVQILKEVDLRLLRELKDNYHSQRALTYFKPLRDSLVADESTSIELKLDSVNDHLNFKGTRLNGEFKRFSNENKLLIVGMFKNGIEDSVWTYYNDQNEISSKEYFKNGELNKTVLFENSKIKSEIKLNTRNEMLQYKYLHLTFISLLVIILLRTLYLNFKKSKRDDIIHVSTFYKIAGSLTLPLGTLIVAKIISTLVPNSYSTALFEIFGEVFLIYLIITPVFLLIFYYLKLRSKFDLMYYILAISLTIVLVEELYYLKSLL